AERVLGTSYALHLLWILVHGQHAQASDDERMAAGTVLKTVLSRQVAALNESERVLLKGALLQGIALPRAPLRRTAALLIAALLKHTSLRSWNELVPALAAMLETGDDGAKEGAFTVLEML